MSFNNLLAPVWVNAGASVGWWYTFHNKPGSAVCDGKRADPGRANDYELRGIFSTMRDEHLLRWLPE